MANFWQFFCQLHKYLSHNLGSAGHFEEVNVYKSQLNQNLGHELQICLKSEFFNFGRKKSENLSFKNGHFMTISGYFFVNYINIFHKTEIQMIILMCLVCKNFIWIKSYNKILVKISFFHA